jgi:hypothetical protein
MTSQKSQSPAQLLETLVTTTQTTARAELPSPREGEDHTRSTSKPTHSLHHMTPTFNTDAKSLTSAGTTPPPMPERTAGYCHYC